MQLKVLGHLFMSADATDAIADDGASVAGITVGDYFQDPFSLGFGVVGIVSLMTLVYIFGPCGSRRSSKYDDDYESEGGMRTKVRHEGGI
jgi:hypothetical protein